MSQSNVTISYSSIIRVVVVLAVLFLLYILREVIALVFIAIILAAAFDPWVDWFQKYKIPRSVSILTIYIIIIGILALVIVLMVPPISEQFSQLGKNLPIYYEKLAIGFSEFSHSTDNSTTLANTMQTISASLGQTTKSIFSTITGIFGGIISFIAVLVIVYYMTVEEEMLKRFIHFITPSRHRSYVFGLINRVQKKIGLWLRGQLILCLVIGVMTYIGLIILGVKYALILAIIAGILEIVPMIGPTVAAIPAMIVGFSDSLTKVILIVALYFAVQQLENHIIVPKIMQKAVGLNPIIVIVAVLVGAKLGGMIGALVSIPVAAALGVVISDIYPREEIIKSKPKSS